MYRIVTFFTRRWLHAMTHNLYPNTTEIEADRSVWLRGQPDTTSSRPARGTWLDSFSKQTTTKKQGKKVFISNVDRSDLRKPGRFEDHIMRRCNWHDGIHQGCGQSCRRKFSRVQELIFVRFNDVFGWDNNSWRHFTITFPGMNGWRRGRQEALSRE